MVSLIVFVMLLCWGSSAMATDYYVATTGSNANDGLSETTPKLTIAHCASIMVAGDTCYVRGGTYTESGGVRLGRSGTQALPIKLMNYPGETPIISFPSQTSTNRILVENYSGSNVAMGWITIEGFEIRNGWEGIKFSNMYNSVIRRNWIHDGYASGIFGAGGHHNTFERNIINHQGNFAGCAAGTQQCNQQHGLYMHGDSYIIRHNIIYDVIGIGIQQNGSSSSSYSSARHPDPAFSGASNWIIAHNTLAYQRYGSGILIWGNLSNNILVENNICYENQQSNGSSSGQCVFFTVVSSATGIVIRNNHAYATTPGGTPFLGVVGGAPVEGVTYTLSSNVVNVSAPGLVNAPSAVPVSPDFRLTSTSPAIDMGVDIGEGYNGAAPDAGAFEAVGNPVCSITTNVITCTFAMNTAVPIQIPSTNGITVNCTGSACPGSVGIGSASRVPGSDSKSAIVVTGITGDACVSANQTWTISYNAASGAWTTFQDIGPYPGTHQPLFSFTNLAVTNLCDGSGPPPAIGTPYIRYAMDDGSGTTVTDSSGNSLHGTLVNGAGWTVGKTGSGVNITGGSQQMTIPYGLGVDPSTQSMTWVVAVNIPSGSEGAINYIFGSEVGSNQRAYLSAQNGTWRVSRQSVNSSAAGPSNLAVTAGWNHLCVRWDATSDTVTLYKDGITGTGGATGSYTSFTLPTNLEMPIVGSGFPSTMSPAVYDDVQIFNTLQDCVAIYNAWNPSAPVVGTFAQAAVRFQRVYLDGNGSPIDLGTAINQAQNVIAGGAVAVVMQIHCQAPTDCAADAFRLEASRAETGQWIAVPDISTAANISFWGDDQRPIVNKGVTTSRLTGSCTVTTGTTRMTSAQIPVVDLPADGCVMIRWIVRVGAISEETDPYFKLRVTNQSGVPFLGGYQYARINVIHPQADGIGW